MSRQTICNKDTTFQNRIKFRQENLIFEENKLGPRVYFIPFSAVGDALEAGNLDRDKSERIVDLNGEWDFLYLKSALDLDTAELRDEDFGTVTVPECWQFHGVEKPFYVNIAYPFPFDPPYVPLESPCAVYRRRVVLNDKFPNKIIHFSGVSSCLELYVNGRYVGYSEGSHNAAEFDIGKFAVCGENEIVAIVFKWCTGSYFEGQDFLRCNGIFRDVYIIEQRECYLFDMDIRTDYADGKGSVTALPVLKGNTEDTRLVLSLYKDGSFLSELKREGERYSLTVDNALPWSAETPEIYRLVAELYSGGELIEASSFGVGFKRIEIKNKVLYWCGKPIKLKGVNYHSVHPESGWAVPFEQLKRDVELMKSFNVNAVRTSHYPADERFMELCSLYGLYVITEADIECHGALGTREGYNYFSEGDKWEKIFLDRVSRMYFRDRSNPAVIMFSLGNESGRIKNHDKCYKFIKEHDENAIVHYENAVFCERLGYDVVSMMYPNIEQCKKHIASPNGKPFFMCEFAHSMGVGAGSLDAYMELIDNNDGFLGGCIWEFCDHSIKGERGALYGGDNGEYVTDGNFCCDGLFNGDRTPHTGAYNMRALYSPIRSEILYDGRKVTLKIKSLYYFKDAVVKAKYSILRNGEEVQSDSINLMIPPREEIERSLIFSEKTDAEYVLGVTFYEGGREIGCNGRILSGEYAPQNSEGRVIMAREGNKLVLKCEGKSAVFDLGRGRLVSLTSGGEELLADGRPSNCFSGSSRGFYPDIYRAPTDNDMYMKAEWHSERYDLMWYNVKSVEVDEQADRTSVKVYGSLAAPSRSKAFDTEIEYTVCGGLNICIDAKIIPCVEGLPDLPRFGLDVALNKTLKSITYYGLGDRENYPDFHSSCLLGLYRTDIKGLRPDYVKPQECGNRGQIRFVKLTDECGRGIAIERNGCDIGFNLYENENADIEAARHPFDLKPSDHLRLSVNGFMCGLGSQSCGMPPLEEYKVKPDKLLGFSFILKIL